MERNDNKNDKTKNWIISAAVFAIVQLLLVIMFVLVFGAVMDALDSQGLLPNILGNYLNVELNNQRIIRFIGMFVIPEGLYWFLRKLFSLDTKGNYSMIKYLSIPAILPLCLSLIFFMMPEPGGFIPLFSNMNEFALLLIIWLVSALAIRAVLSLTHKMLGGIFANILAITVMVVSLIVLL